MNIENCFYRFNYVELNGEKLIMLYLTAVEEIAFICFGKMMVIKITTFPLWIGLDEI
jgi:hypothetical protein